MHWSGCTSFNDIVAARVARSQVPLSGFKSIVHLVLPRWRSFVLACFQPLIAIGYGGSVLDPQVFATDHIIKY